MRRTPSYESTPSIYSQYSNPPSRHATPEPHKSDIIHFFPTPPPASRGRRRAGTPPHPQLHASRSLDRLPNVPSLYTDEPFNVGRPVYYRVYTQDSLKHCRKSVWKDDLSLGYTLAHHVPPPHTAAKLRRHIANKEGILHHTTVLYEDVTRDKPLSEDTMLSITAASGVGYSVHEPLALVVTANPVPEDGMPTVSASHIATEQFTGRRIYYRVYDECGVLNTKVPVPHIQDTTLGMTFGHLIPPPHSPRTLAQHIKMLENITSTAPIDMFVNLQSPMPIETDIPLALMEEDGPGSNLHQPLILLLADANNTANTTYISSVDEPLTSLSPSLHSVSTVHQSSNGSGSSVMSVYEKPKGWILVQMNEDQVSDGLDNCHSVRMGDVLYMAPYKHPRESTSMWHRHEAVFPGSRDIKFIVRPGSTSRWMGGRDSVTQMKSVPPELGRKTLQPTPPTSPIRFPKFPWSSSSAL